MCGTLLQGRTQALVDQLVGIAQMLEIGMAPEAFGNLAAHLSKVAAAGQLGLDAYARYHGELPPAVYTDATIEFMKLVG